MVTVPSAILSTSKHLRMEKEKIIQELLEDMSHIMTKKWPGKKLPKSMSVTVARMIESAHNNDKTVLLYERLIEFANMKVEEKLLKIMTSDVPENILPEGYTGIMSDVRLSGYHTDDKIYNDYPDIQQKIPRGTTLLELKTSGETIQDVVIYANRKFTGDIGDEGEINPQYDNDQWKHYFLKDQEETQQIVCMKKINGEAAHFSARMINGQFYIITGSKNVHIFIKDEKDIDKYVSDRFLIAKVVARCVWDTLQSLEENHQKFLLKFLSLTKCTVICEILQPEYMHIINLSKLKKPLLNAISLTPPAGDESLSSLVAFPPHHTLDLLSSLGLTVPAYTTIQLKDVDRHRDEVRRGIHGYCEEGEVLYYLNENEETIGLVKIKTMWYIMLRALREKVIHRFHMSRRQKQQTHEECISSCYKRFAEIQDWLLFSSSYLEGWKKLAESFIMWIAEEVKEEHVMVEDIRPKYPIMWEKFLQVTNQTDHVEL